MLNDCWNFIAAIGPSKTVTTAVKKGIFGEDDGPQGELARGQLGSLQQLGTGDHLSSRTDESGRSHR